MKTLPWYEVIFKVCIELLLLLSVISRIGKNEGQKYHFTYRHVVDTVLNPNWVVYLNLSLPFSFGMFSCLTQVVALTYGDRLFVKSDLNV